MAAELHGTYDFNKVNLVVGVRSIKGFDDGSEIVAERSEDSFSLKIDVDGGGTRSRTNNSSGMVTFSLSQYAEDNSYLQDLMNLDERLGAGVFPLKIVDRANPSNERVISLRSWVQKPANRSFGRESGPREWIIQCLDLNFL